MNKENELMRRLKERDDRIGLSESAAIVAYKLTRSDCTGWIFGGTTPKEVAEALQNELDNHDGLSIDECGEISIVAYETTRK